MIRVMALYPRGEGTHFNSEYWLNTHMPMLPSKWPKLKKWEADIAEADSPYYAIAHIFFDSLEDFQESMSSAATGEVLGDIPNYTNTSPILSTGTVSATS